jgi:hypothetical protein
MAKRFGAMGRGNTRAMRHPRKTKKRQEAKRQMLAARAAK